MGYANLDLRYAKDTHTGYVISKYQRAGRNLPTEKPGTD